MVATNETFAESLEHIKQYSIIVIDLETQGLRPYHGDLLCGVAIYSGGKSFYFPFRHGEGCNLDPEKMDGLRALLSLPNKVFVMWNAKFDLQFLMRDRFPMPSHVEDVMLAAHLMDEHRLDKGKDYQLKNVGREYIDKNARDEAEELSGTLMERGYIVAKGKGKGGADKGKMWMLPGEMVGPYAEQDVLLTYKLREFYKKYLAQYDLIDLWLEANEFLICVTQMERRGILLDVPEIHSRMTQSVTERELEMRTIEKIAGFPINPNSWQQVGKFLNIPSTREEYLITVKHPVVPHILRHRKWTKVSGAYYDKFLESMDAKNAIHPNLNMVGTITGRFSCSNPNLQAIPREAGENDPRTYVKNVFISRPGFSLLQADYRQAEIFLGAHYASEQGLLNLIESAHDLHQETANVLGISRDAAKRLNFAMMYGIGPDELSSDIGCSLQQATLYLDTYNHRFPKMKQLYYDMQKQAKRDGYIRLFTGRMKRYPDAYPFHHKASSNLIQGGVAEIMRIAATNLHKQLYGEGFFQLLHVHDSVFAEVPDYSIPWMVQAVNDIMTDLTPHKFAVDFRVDIKVGKRWSNLEPVSA